MDSEYLKSDLARAIESHDESSIENLNKNETIFYLCSVLDVEPPASHPSEHNGTVPRSISQEWAKTVAQEARENDESDSE